MLDGLEENEQETLEEIDNTDYTAKGLKIKKKLLRKIFVVAVSSCVILITSIIDKHDDFDVVLKSNLFLFLLFGAIVASAGTLIYLYNSKNIEFDKKTCKKHKGLLDIMDLLAIVPAFMVILTVLNVFMISPSFIDGASMEPNYYDGDDILFWHFNNEYERYDVVILKANPNDYWIKRVIGLPGETVVIDQGTVYVNGIEIEQDFLRAEDGSINDYTVCRSGDANYCEFNVPAGEYFVLGDNRSVSDDSRSSNLGFVTEKQLFGKVVFKFNNFLRN